MLCDVVRRRRRRRWAHAPVPVIHAASHFDHKKRVAWVPISMHTRGSFFYNCGAPLQILKKMLQKSSQFLSSEQPCEPKSLDVALKITGVEKIPSENLWLRST